MGDSFLFFFGSRSRNKKRHDLIINSAFTWFSPFNLWNNNCSIKTLKREKCQALDLFSIPTHAEAMNTPFLLTSAWGRSPDSAMILGQDFYALELLTFWTRYIFIMKANLCLVWCLSASLVSIYKILTVLKAWTTKTISRYSEMTIIRQKHPQLKPLFRTR